MKPTALPQITEADVLAQCLEALRMLGLEPERQNTGAATYEGRCGKPRHVRYGTPGAADIRGVLPDGRAYEIEAKKPGKKPTPDQFARIRRINASKGVAFWVTDPEQLMRVMPLILRGCWIVEEGGQFFATNGEDD
jgi:hypothetical protein